ncbi:unannotated protein [freshwater metagenome]|uniref:Unannotated protein n=1 Tax=freshwater metagenome TaxID=449393 RepID=A0A6J6PFU0_9ZZZZ
MRVTHVEGVTRTRVIHVLASVLLVQAVVGTVVEPLETEQRSAPATLGRVVINHVQDHFNSGFVQGLDHDLELLHLLPRLATHGVLIMRRKETNRVVTPVVAKAHLHEPTIMNELMNRHQLNRRHTQVVEVFNNRWGTHTEI